MGTVAIETMRAGVVLVTIRLSTFSLASRANATEHARFPEGHGSSRLLAQVRGRLMRRCCGHGDHYMALYVFPWVTLRGADAAHEGRVRGVASALCTSREMARCAHGGGS
jgi:hypothetical protein